MSGIAAAILIGCLIIADAICYVHGHKSWFFTAKTDYEKRIIEKIREGK